MGAGVLPVEAGFISLKGVLDPFIGVDGRIPAGVLGGDLATGRGIPSTSSERNIMNVASISSLGWNSSQPRSSLGLYPSFSATAAATAAAELNSMSSRSAAVRNLALRSRLGTIADTLRGSLGGLRTAAMGVSVPSSSMKRPPPPAPPGMYLLLLGAGSVCGTAEGVAWSRVDRPEGGGAGESSRSRALRVALVVPGGRPRFRPVKDRLGVEGFEGMFRDY